MMYPKFKEHQETIDAHPDVSILITTLQEWSKENLGANVIYDTEVIDRDAGISKGYQLMMIEEAYEKLKVKLGRDSRLYALIHLQNLSIQVLKT